jgi:hypothetical protein
MMPARPAQTRAIVILPLREAFVAAGGALILLAAMAAASAQPTTARMTQGAPTRDGGTSTLAPNGSVNGRHVSTTGHAHHHGTGKAPAKAPRPDDNT